MKAIWFFYLAEILLLALFKPLITNVETVGVIAVLIHVVFAMLILFTSKKNLRGPFLLGYSLRVSALFWDIYARAIFRFPNSGSDTEMYYRTSIEIANNLSKIGSTRGGLYSDINGLLFSLIGPYRIVAQYSNVLLGLTTIYFILKTLSVLGIGDRNKRKNAFFLALYPNAIIFSAIFLREMLPTFLISISLYYFVRWFKSEGLSSLVLSFIFLSLASSFHMGVIGVVVGYIYAFLFYQQKADKFQFRARTILSFLILLVLFYFSYTTLSAYIFRKFINIESINDLYGVATSSGLGGSAYLKGLEVNSFFEFILYSPIKSIYFLLSPLPWTWRGITDVFTFFFDSMLYGWVTYSYITYRKKIKKNRSILEIIFWMILGAVFIFGVGVSNAGTAMRHRHKIMPLFVVLQSLILDERKKYKTGKLTNH